MLILSKKRKKRNARLECNFNGFINNEKKGERRDKLNEISPCRLQISSEPLPVSLLSSSLEMIGKSTVKHSGYSCERKGSDSVRKGGERRRRKERRTVVRPTTGP